MSETETCDCGALGVWFYMPMSDQPKPYYCEEHVPRGCSCNINPETGVEDTDELGRLLPCCEYYWFGYLEESP